ncbi:MAG: hypothetical protein AAFO94_02100 [Bacteroidota bacterium]
MYYVTKQSSLIVSLLLLFSLSCTRENVLPSISEIDKAKRERIGDLIKAHIEAESSMYDILPNHAPYDTIYDYIQLLYNQATNAIRVDNRSPSSDRWDFDRTWQIIILQNDFDRIAFALPGGHLCISTGFLKTLEREYELFYVLAYEAAMLDKRILLNGLLAEFNSQVLLEFATGVYAPGDEKTQELVASFFTLGYDEMLVAEADKAAAQIICQTSLYDRFGLLPILDRLNNNDHWLRTRPKYAGRSNRDNLERYPVEGRCGDLKTNGGYRKYVRDKLN